MEEEPLENTPPSFLSSNDAKIPSYPLRPYMGQAQSLPVLPSNPPSVLASNVTSCNNVEDSVCVSDSVSRCGRGYNNEVEGQGEDDEETVQKLMDLIQDVLGTSKIGEEGVVEDEEVLLLNKIAEVLNVLPNVIQQGGTTAVETKIEKAHEKASKEASLIETPSSHSRMYYNQILQDREPSTHPSQTPQTLATSDPPSPNNAAFAKSLVPPQNDSVASFVARLESPSEIGPAGASTLGTHHASLSKKKSLFPPPAPIPELPKIEYESFAADDDTFLEVF